MSGPTIHTQIAALTAVLTYARRVTSTYEILGENPALHPPEVLAISHKEIVALARMVDLAGDCISGEADNAAALKMLKAEGFPV